MNAARIVACPNPPFRSPDFTSSMSSPGSIGVGTARGTWRYPAITAIFTRDRTCPASTHRMVESASSQSPREDRGEGRFETRGLLLLGLTSTGRITVSVLAMNSQAELETRAGGRTGPLSEVLLL